MKIPYGKQTINEDDISAVLKVLEENEMLTTGKYVPKFEDAICKYIGCKHALAVNSGTAALHLATYAINIQSGDEVIVPAISFVASANCVLYQQGTPVFCDIDPNTLNIDHTKIEALITPKTKAVIMVDMCGQPCNYDEIRAICDKHNLHLIQDAAHSLGGKYKGNKVGSYSDISCLSFHPVKNITTCEGGMMVTNNEEFYKRALAFRTHGISRDFKEREKMNSHYYDMGDLGFNYRIPDLLCALGIEQLKRLDFFIGKRNAIASTYREKLDKNEIACLDEQHYSAYHIVVVKLLHKNRDTVFKQLKEQGIIANVHYMPIYLHSYYQKLGYKKGLCPEAEKVYEQIITLPCYPLLTAEEQDYVIDTLNRIVKE